MNFRRLIVFGIVFLMLFARAVFSQETEGSVALDKIITEIQFVGIENVPAGVLPTEEELLTKRGRRVIKADLIQDINRIYLTGYFYEVRAQTVATRNQVILQFVVKENPVLDELIITGNNVFSDKDLFPLIKSMPGQVLNVGFIRDDQERLTEHYVSKGYDIFKVVSIVITSSDILVYDLAEGEIVDIEFQGLRTIKPFVLLREMETGEGSVFNSSKLRQDRERLLRLGYFSQISAPRLEETADHRIRIIYQITEKRVNRIDLGLELEERDQRVVTFFKTDLNHVLMHTDFLSGKVQLGDDDSILTIKSYSVKYRQPWIFNLIPVSVDLDFWTEFDRERLSIRENNRFFENKRIGADIIFGVPLIRDVLTFSAKGKTERVTPLEPVPNVNEYQINSLSAALQYSSISDRFNPRSGTYWSIEVEKGGQLGTWDLGGLNFNRVDFNAASFVELMDRFVLATHLFLGRFSPDEDDVITFEREGYELGGANSLRGYKELNPFFGLSETLVNVELRYDIHSALQGVLFYDIGRTSEVDFRSGMGFGFRFFTPVGPIRTDFAWGEAFIIHFGLGQMF